MTDQRYGCEVPPNGPLMDMAAVDVLTGSYPPQGRDASPVSFTGGTGGGGLGGQAEPPANTNLNAPGGGPTPGATGTQNGGHFPVTDGGI